MKVISNAWGEYMDYCAKNNKMPTEEGFKIYMEALKKVIICK